jgi:hypothetical protein
MVLSDPYLLVSKHTTRSDVEYHRTKDKDGETVHLGENGRRSERSLSPLSAPFTPALDGGLPQKPRRLAAPRFRT